MSDETEQAKDFINASDILFESGQPTIQSPNLTDGFTFSTINNLSDVKGSETAQGGNTPLAALIRTIDDSKFQDNEAYKGSTLAIIAVTDERNTEIRHIIQIKRSIGIKGGPAFATMSMWTIEPNHNADYGQEALEKWLPYNVQTPIKDLRLMGQIMNVNLTGETLNLEAGLQSVKMMFPNIKGISNPTYPFLKPDRYPAIQIPTKLLKSGAIPAQNFQLVKQFMPARQASK